MPKPGVTVVGSIAASKALSTHRFCSGPALDLTSLLIIVISSVEEQSSFITVHFITLLPGVKLFTVVWKDDSSPKVAVVPELH